MIDYLLLAAGVLCAGIGGELFVRGAVGLAHSARISPGIIGAMIVAAGTSIPELAITVIAKLRGHEEVALGTILGSNIFNGLLIVPVAAMVQNIA